MRRSHILIAVVTLGVSLLASVAVSAQTGQLRGHVVIKQADGTTVPAVGAQIDVYRSDLAGKYSLKTDKKGQFTHAGLPYVGTYTLAVSAPNAAPTTQANVKVGRDIDYEIVLSPGDGRRLTEAEAKAGGGSSGPGAGSQTREGESAADRAKREELEKKNAEIRAANEKIEGSNKILQDKFKLGNTAIIAAQKAISEKNTVDGERFYSDAIREFDEGLAADPNHPGAPSLLTNKAVALKERGVLRYNAVITSEKYVAALKANDGSGPKMLEPAQSDWKAAFESATKAVEMLKAQEQPADANQLAGAKQNKYFALVARAESANKFVTRVDQSQVDVAMAAYQEYLAAETDPAKKSKAQLDLAQMLLDAGATEKAIIEYQKILDTDPNNVDALYGMGVAQVNIGYSANDKAKLQLAVNTLQRFVDVAPETNKYKAEAKAIIEAMKSEQQLVPVKTTKPPTRRRP